MFPSCSVVAIELLAACQAIEFLRPLKTTAPLEEVYRLVRTVASPLEMDRYMAPDMNAVTQLLQDERVSPLSLSRASAVRFCSVYVRDETALVTGRPFTLS